jgi:hypothetical protein
MIDKTGKRVYNSRMLPLPKTVEEYNKLKESGMMWEFFPRFTGDFETDINEETTKDN